MKVLVTGAGGQLGHDVMEELADRGIEGVGTYLAEDEPGVVMGIHGGRMPGFLMDITDTDEVRDSILRERPDAVIHCAAWTQVDSAEDKPEACRRVNAFGTENIARICGELHIPVMYFSTDYVFDGTGTRPWQPGDERHPLDVYGQTKAEGEIAVQKYCEHYFILRIAWVFGVNGRNFVKTMLKLAKTHDTVRVVSDQIGNPTYTPDLARLVVDMIVTDRYGIYHVTNEGEPISWYDFTKAIYRIAGVDNVTVLPVTSEEYGAKAKRPSNSRMDRSAVPANGFKPLPHWGDAVTRYIEVLRETEEI